MTRLHGHMRPGTTTLFVVFLALAGIAAFWAEPAPAVTGTAGPATVTITGNANAANGQVAHIHAQATSGDLFEIRAHICAGGAAIRNTFNFSFDGAFCTPTALAAGSDAATLVAIPAGSGGKGDLAFRIGQGTGKPWTDFWGTTHTLTCGPRNACELVVQLQVTDSTVFYTAPICYGAPCPTTGGPDPATTTPAAAGGGATPVATTAVGAGTPAGAGTAITTRGTGKPAGHTTRTTATHSTVTTAAAGGASGSASGVASPATPTGAGSTGSPSNAASGSSSSNRHPAGLESVSTTVFGRFTAHQALRVFAAGLAGLIGGILLALIGSQARRQMMGIET
jgi:hypothetical protein